MYKTQVRPPVKNPDQTHSRKISILEEDRRKATRVAKRMENLPFHRKV